MDVAVVVDVVVVFLVFLLVALLAVEMEGALTDAMLLVTVKLVGLFDACLCTVFNSLPVCFGFFVGMGLTVVSCRLVAFVLAEMVMVCD